MKQAKMLLFSQYIFSQWYELTLFLQLVNCSGSGAPNFSVEILHPFINLLFKAEKIWECATCGRHRWKEKKTSLYTMTVTQTAQMRWAVLCFPTSKGLTLAWSLINVMGWCIGEVACIVFARKSQCLMSHICEAGRSKSNSYLFRIVTCSLKPRLLFMFLTFPPMISMCTVLLISLGHFIWFIFKREENGICFQTLVYVSNTIPCKFRYECKLHLNFLL